MTTENTSAESVSATPEAPAFNAADQNTWTEEQQTHWENTGEQPTEKPKETPAESAAASTSEKKTDPSEPKGKSAAESGAAKTQEKTEKGKPTADERIGELTGEIKVLQKRLEEALKAKPAERAAAELPKKVEPLKRPNPFTWTGTPEEYDKAMDEYDKQLRANAVAESHQQSIAQQRNQAINAKVTEARERYGAEKFDSVVEPTSQAIAKEAQPIVKQWIQNSEMFADLLYVIGGDEKTMNYFLADAKANPTAAIRKLAFLEIEIGKELAKNKGKGKEAAPAGEAGKENNAEPSARPKPGAPKPPSVVGGRGTAPKDPLAAAAESGDFSSFEAEENRRKFANA